MHKMIRKIWLCVLLIGLLGGVGGCSAKKEILLERSVSQEESVPQQEVPSENVSIYVYICGEVQDPGVYEMHAEDRVYTLIERAGGLTDEADERAVNQAEALTDGQMLYIPSVEENEGQSSGQGGSDQNASSGGQQETSGTDGKVNINTANLEELITLPGIGEGKAKNILSYREAHGPFGSVEEIMNVDGIKEGTYTKMKDRIIV